MSTKPPNLELYFFETAERISRFLLHLEDIDKQFYSEEKKVLKDKLEFKTSYHACLNKSIEVLLNLYSLNKGRLSIQTKIAISDKLEWLNKSTHNLQSKLLVHLPRPSEPVELRRFCRVIRKQIIKLDDALRGDITIYVNEEAGDNVYASDPLEQFKQNEINALIDSINRFNKKNKSAKSIKAIKSSSTTFKKKVQNIHISIPRLDANNPCHWPSLIHEVSHNLMKDDWFNNKGIDKDFIDFLSKNLNAKGIGDLQATIADRKINISGWLIECWCDLFACALIGPSFFFSQFSTFLHSLSTNKNDQYPPNAFRLKLIAKFISHRYKNLVDDKNFSQLLRECEDLVLQVDSKNNNVNFLKDEQLSLLFVLFNQYFIQEFFILNDGLLNFKHDELRKLFDNIGDFVNNFSITKIEKLVESVDSGFPIPSYREKQFNNPLHEEPNSVQEIFLASWIFRNGKFKDRVIKHLKALSVLDTNSQAVIDEFSNSIVKEFERFDKSILRSIQVSEWVDLLKDDGSDRTDDANFDKLVNASFSKTKRNDLVDHDIYQSLLSNELKIIPLINIKKQLGGTSLDIRLGNSFEVFFPNQFGIVDFTRQDIYNKVKKNSKKYDLDFVDFIPINPGQFMLGHSMEYIKLPDNVSADLEGRSSFARLGIEIHMTAGFVDPGFEGVLTFEIFNAGTNPIMLYPGFRIGQLRFTESRKPIISYSARNATKYRRQFEHDFSLQGRDYEIAKIFEERGKK